MRKERKFCPVFYFLYFLSLKRRFDKMARDFSPYIFRQMFAC